MNLTEKQSLTVEGVMGYFTKVHQKYYQTGRIASADQFIEEVQNKDTPVGKVFRELTSEIYVLHMIHFTRTTTFMNQMFRWRNTISRLNFHFKQSVSIQNQSPDAMSLWLSAADRYYGEQVTRKLNSIGEDFTSTVKPLLEATYQSLSQEPHRIDKFRAFHQVRSSVGPLVSTATCCTEVFSDALRLTRQWLKSAEMGRKIRKFLSSSSTSSNAPVAALWGETGGELDSPLWMFYFLFLLLGTQHQTSALFADDPTTPHLLAEGELIEVMGLLSRVMEGVFQIPLTTLNRTYVQANAKGIRIRFQRESCQPAEGTDRDPSDLLTKVFPRTVRNLQSALEGNETNGNNNGGDHKKIQDEVRTIVVGEMLLTTPNEEGSAKTEKPYAFHPNGTVKVEESFLFQLLKSILENQLRVLLQCTSEADFIDYLEKKSASEGVDFINIDNEDINPLKETLLEPQKQALASIQNIANSLSEICIGGEIEKNLLQDCGFCPGPVMLPVTPVGFDTFRVALSAAMERIATDIVHWSIPSNETSVTVEEEMEELTLLFRHSVLREPLFYLLTSSHVDALKSGKYKFCDTIREEFKKWKPKSFDFYTFPALNAIHRFLLEAELTGKRGQKESAAASSKQQPLLLHNGMELHSAIRLFSVSESNEYVDLGSYLDLMKERLLYRPPTRDGKALVEWKRELEGTVLKWLKLYCQVTVLDPYIKQLELIQIPESEDLPIRLETHLLSYQVWKKEEINDKGDALLHPSLSTAKDAPLPVHTEVAKKLAAAQEVLCKKNSEHVLKWLYDNTCRCAFTAEYPNFLAKIHCTFQAYQLFTAVALTAADGVTKDELCNRGNLGSTTEVDRVLKPFIKDKLLLVDAEKRLRLNYDLQAKNGRPEQKFIYWPSCKRALTIPNSEEREKKRKENIDLTSIVLMKIMKAVRKKPYRDLIEELVASPNVHSPQIAKDTIEFLIEKQYIRRVDTSNEIEYMA